MAAAEPLKGHLYALSTLKSLMLGYCHDFTFADLLLKQSESDGFIFYILHTSLDLFVDDFT